MNDVVYVDDNNFEAEVMQSKLPVLVDFGAEWCGPCHRQLPIIEQYATNNANRIKVCKVDIDEAPTIIAKFIIRSVPTLLLFNNGEKLDTKVGLTNLAAIDSFVMSKVG